MEHARPTHSDYGVRDPGLNTSQRTQTLPLANMEPEAIDDSEEGIRMCFCKTDATP
jgi:hypothetical protein